MVSAAVNTASSLVGRLGRIFQSTPAPAISDTPSPESTPLTTDTMHASKTYYCTGADYKDTGNYQVKGTSTSDQQAYLYKALKIGTGCLNTTLRDESMADLPADFAKCGVVAIMGDAPKTKNTQPFAGTTDIVYEDRYGKYFCGYYLVLATTLNSAVAPAITSCLASTLDSEMADWNHYVKTTDCTDWALIGKILGGVAGSIGVMAGLCYYCNRRPQQAQGEAMALGGEEYYQQLEGGQAEGPEGAAAQTAQPTATTRPREGEADHEMPTGEPDVEAEPGAPAPIALTRLFS